MSKITVVLANFRELAKECGFFVFDEGFVSKLYASAGKDFLPVYDLDVLAMARELLPKPHKLGVVADALGVSDGIQFHTAIDDAKATFEVYKKLAAMYF